MIGKFMQNPTRNSVLVAGTTLLGAVVGGSIALAHLLEHIAYGLLAK